MEGALSGANPLVPGACEIDGEIRFDIIWTVDPDNGNQTASVTVSGWRDQFPAHEVYVQDQPVIQYDPVQEFGGEGASTISDHVIRLCFGEIQIPSVTNTVHLP